jgi:hypothetical protein
MNENERSELISYISDAHKELWGVRPHGDRYEIPTGALRIWADRLSAEIAASIEERDRERREWVEKRAGYFAAPPLTIGDLVDL